LREGRCGSKADLLAMNADVRKVLKRTREGRARFQSSVQFSTKGRSTMRVLILSLIVLSAALAPALAAPATIEGSWRGSGTVSHRGSADAVRCRARFTKAGGASFGVSSQCATATGRYDVSGRVTRSGGNRYSGRVTNGQGATSSSFNTAIASPSPSRAEGDRAG
jgi:hypothetical protein